MELDENISFAGVLPVDEHTQIIEETNNSKDIDEKSQLLELLWEKLTKNSTSEILNKDIQHNTNDIFPVRSMIIDPLSHGEAKVPNKPLNGDGTENSFYSSGGGWDSYETSYYENYQNLYDVFGSNAIQDGIVTVEIIGQRIDSHWNFDQVYVNFDEYYYTNDGGNNDEGGGSSGPPTTECGPVGDGVSLVDWSKIRQLEGFRLDGYVPLKDGKVVGNSGVTIASGFDIGQRNMYDLAKLGFGQELFGKFHAYLGVTGDAAVKLLANRPLQISIAEAETVNRAVHAATLASLVTSYDNAVKTPGGFFELPAEAQTVIASVSFQYGNLATETPKFWNQIVNKDWTSALANLWNFEDEFKTRRHTEAALLEKAISEGRLHNGRLC